MPTYPHASIVVKLPRILFDLSTPEALCSIIGRSEGRTKPKRDFECFPVPFDLMEWFAPLALELNISVELEVFRDTIRPFVRYQSHTVTRYVEATHGSEASWSENPRVEAKAPMVGKVANHDPGTPRSLHRLQTASGTLYALTTLAPPLGEYDRQLDRKEGFG
jgi:hypothetical protein